MFEFIKKWHQSLMALSALMALVFVISLIVMNETKQEHIIVVDLQDNADPFEVIPQLLPGQITEVREINREKNEYRIKVKSGQKTQKLLNWLLRTRQVENARYD